LQCCSPEIEGGRGWGIFNGILGWTNSATYSTVIVYNIYWILVIAGFLALRYHEVRRHWPLMRPKKPVESNGTALVEEGSSTGEVDAAVTGLSEKPAIQEKTADMSVLEAISSD
jgi:high-affinity iron transporter